MFPACDNMLKAASFGKHIFVRNDTCDAYLSCTLLPQWHHHGQADWSVFECASQKEGIITITSSVTKISSGSLSNNFVYIFVIENKFVGELKSCTEF